jgi:hypothetical protein
MAGAGNETYTGEGFKLGHSAERRERQGRTSRMTVPQLT